MRPVNLIIIATFLICITMLYIVTFHVVNHPVTVDKAQHVDSVQYRTFFEYNVYGKDTVAVDTVCDQIITNEVQPR